MIELIFVFVVVGIISAMIIPRIDRDNIFEAASQLSNHIKYTQHLAMTEDVFNDASTTWFMQRWEIHMYACGGYTVHSDRAEDGGNGARSDAALDPQTRKSLFTTSGCAAPLATDFEKVNMSIYLGVASLSFTGCGGNQQISFDNLGRPYTANTINGVLKTNCDILITDTSGNSETVRIHPETGYTCILNGLNCI